MLSNIIDNIEQCLQQQKIVRCCFQQPWTSWAIFAVYVVAWAPKGTWDGILHVNFKLVHSTTRFSNDVSFLTMVMFKLIKSDQALFMTQRFDTLV